MKTLMLSLGGSLILAMGLAALMGFPIIPVQVQPSQVSQLPHNPDDVFHNYYSVTFPQISGEGAEIYSGTHKLPYFGVRNRWGRTFLGHNAAQIILNVNPNDPTSIPSLRVTVPDWPPAATCPNCAVYAGTSPTTLQLSSASHGTGWPATISVQWVP